MGIASCFLMSLMASDLKGGRDVGYEGKSLSFGLYYYNKARRETDAEFTLAGDMNFKMYASVIIARFPALPEQDKFN